MRIPTSTRSLRNLAAEPTSPLSLFDNFFREFFTAPNAPTERSHHAPINIAETESAISIEIELPGVKDEDIDVEVLGNQLTVRASRRFAGNADGEREQPSQDYHTVEHRYGNFSRRIDLPRGLDTSAVDASLGNGILSLTVPKTEPVTAKKVTIRRDAAEPQGSSSDTPE